MTAIETAWNEYKQILRNNLNAGETLDEEYDMAHMKKEFEEYYNDKITVWYMYESPANPIISRNKSLENREGEIAGIFSDFSADGMYDILNYYNVCN